MTRTSHGCTGWHSPKPFIPSRYGLAAIAALAFLLASTALQARPPGNAPGVPSDADLESCGAVIGNIAIDNENIFNLDDPKDDKALFRLADHLHFKTRASVIGHQLLFKPGDPYSRRLLDESERVLRQEGYFYDAWIRAVRYHDGKVDVVVTEGFAGNIALKTAEGTARQIGEYLKGAIGRSLSARIGYLFAQSAFRQLRERMDPRRANGGVFLGLNGIVIKSHGGTDAEGFAAAIELGHGVVQDELLARIRTALARHVRSRPQPVGQMLGGAAS